MTIVENAPDLGHAPSSAEEVLTRVNALVPVLRERARETELLRRMHPDNLRALTDAGVFRLTLPKTHGGFEAEPRVLSEILAQIARGCPSTGWATALIVTASMWAGLLPDEGAAELYSTPDLRVTGLIAPTGSAVDAEGGAVVTGQWNWNTAGNVSNWIGLAALRRTDRGPLPVLMLARAEDVEMEDNWDASGMAGTGTNIIRVKDLFVPEYRIIRVPDLAAGTFPRRALSDDPYFNRPMIQFFMAFSAPTMLGIARGATDVYLEKLPGRSITYTNYSKAIEAPLTHTQIAHARFDLEIAEMYVRAGADLIAETFGKDVPLENRVRTRAWLGQVAAHARACVNQLFEASGASSIQHSAPLQRYFRDVNSLALHALIQPTTSDELYGRMLAGLEPNTAFL